MINRKFYFMWRKRGETAASAARLASGSQAIADETIVVTEESDPEGCQCEDVYKGYPCAECKDYRRRNHEDLKQVNRRHKCQCRYYWRVFRDGSKVMYAKVDGGILQPVAY